MKLFTEIDGLSVIVDYSIEGDIRSYAIINSIHDLEGKEVDYHSEYDLEFECEQDYCQLQAEAYLKRGEII